MSVSESMTELRTPGAVAANGYWFVYDGTVRNETPVGIFTSYFEMGEIPIGLPDVNPAMHQHDMMHYKHYEKIFSQPAFAALIQTAAENSTGNTEKEEIFGTALDHLGDSMESLANDHVGEKNIHAMMLHRVTMLVGLSLDKDALECTAEEIRIAQTLLDAIGFRVFPRGTEVELKEIIAWQAGELARYKALEAVYKNFGADSSETYRAQREYHANYLLAPDIITAVA